MWKQNMAGAAGAVSGETQSSSSDSALGKRTLAVDNDAIDIDDI